MNDPGLKAKRILFIVNPISGGRKKNLIIQAIEKRLGNSGIEYRIAETERPGHASDLSREAIAGNTDVIVAVGGDGTINETASAMINTDTSLGIIPTGSGNGLARHLKIPFNLQKALDTILAGKVITIDTGTLDDQVFLNIAGVGYDAFIARKFADAGKRGFLTYLKVITREYRNYKPRKYELVIDGRTIKRRALMVSFANSSQYGNNASIDPTAIIDDGFIDVCIVRKIPLYKLPFIIPLLFMKRFDKTVFVEILKAKEVRVTRKRGKSIHVDGDPFTHGKQFDIKVFPLSLKIIVP